MRAIAFNSYGGHEVLEPMDLPMPDAGPGEIVIKVAAAAVNPADGKWRSGMFQGFAPVPFPHVVGYDVAGTVVSGGGLLPGTRVCAMLDSFTKGGYAEYAKVSATSVAAIPDGVSFETAAAVPTAALTGLQMVERAADVQAGQRILVTGALGAVGQAIVQAAKAREATVIAAVRAGREAEALAAGAADVAVIGEEWTGAPFDHVLDTVGGAAVARLCRALKPGGTIITAATTPIDPEGLVASPEFYGVQSDGADLARLLALVASGALPMPVAKVMPLEAAAEAQKLVDAGGTGGKIILRP